MITAAGVDHQWHRVPAPFPPVWDISDICSERGEMTIYDATFGVIMTRQQNDPLLARHNVSLLIQSFSPLLHRYPNIRVQKYIEALTSKTRPKKILVCMIYYPDENNVPSWANAALGTLGYNRNPAKLQLLIRKVFEEATRYVM